MRDVDLAEGKTGNVGRRRVHDEIVILYYVLSIFACFLIFLLTILTSQIRKVKPREVE